MTNLADGIRQSFLNNLGKQGIKQAYNNISSKDEDDEDKKRRVRLAALQKHIANYSERE